MDRDIKRERKKERRKIETRFEREKMIKNAAEEERERKAADWC